MTFSSKIKQEINEMNNLKKKELVKSELIGYLISSNSDVSKLKIRYSTENEYNINRFSRLLLNLDIKHDINIKGKVYVIEFKKVELESGIDINKIDKYIEERANMETENLKSLIRGIFMGSGRVTDPEKTYHLELSVEGEKRAKQIQGILNKFGVKAKNHSMDDRYTIYIKDAEEISKFLAVIGANKAVLNFEEVRIQKEMNGKVNRLVNCKSANLNKTLNASITQIAAIEKLKRSNKLDLLEEELNQLALVRIKYPDVSLVELGKLLDKPIGKSAVNYRLKKIVEVANEI